MSAIVSRQLPLGSIEKGRTLRVSYVFSSELHTEQEGEQNSVCRLSAPN